MGLRDGAEHDPKMLPHSAIAPRKSSHERDVEESFPLEVKGKEPSPLHRQWARAAGRMFIDSFPGLTT